MKKTYRGSCHCGVVRFEADADITAGTNKCNCSICTKTRNWNMLLKPEAFRLKSGEHALAEYRFNTRVHGHYFCRHCGVKLFARGHVKEIGGDYITVQVMALDDLDLNELLAAPVYYADGSHDNWSVRPAETRHL
jgi:hypothetical protein